MLSKLHNRLGTAGLVVAVVALVVALAGTAFAATKLNGTQKKEVEKIAKKFAGKNGTNGTNGASGANGKDGAEGKQGPEGKAGANGKSVETGTATSTPVTGECPEVGGTTVQVAGEPATKKKICNGKNGTTGFTETLPSGKTETGAWSYAKTSTVGGIPVTVSFAIPLSTAIPSGKAHFVYTTGKEIEESPPGSELFIEVTRSTDCPGTAAAPTAVAGSFCIYAAKMTGTIGTTGIVPLSSLIGSPGEASSSGGKTGNTGAITQIFLEAGSSEGWGTWAVKAP